MAARTIRRTRLNLTWSGIVRLIAFPDPNLRQAEVGDLDQEHALGILFELLNEFLAERETAKPTSDQDENR
ncbi:hypothetical protein [Myceligenerans xiligouense]|uniref:Uncharacterized protein n=1 Tax=Myceligenerans xiligouense TaxID=253184 RepID=A0A3N4YL64_9MICO|nr:hypothetical protein [Myceligenerans xiligouense]RPF21443.1 hypothetical protein EDD34_2071 [Myceligenerans xiligouense]